MVGSFLMFVYEIMPPRLLPLSQLKDDLGNVRERLANVATILQKQEEAGSSLHTLFERYQTVEQFDKLKPLVLNCGPNPVEAKQLIMQIKKIFEVMVCEEQIGFNLALLCFKLNQKVSGNQQKNPTPNKGSNHVEVLPRKIL